MRALWVMLLVGVTLAGCAGGSQTTTTDEQFVDIDTKATATTGVIRGVVFDAAIVPIEGAKVTIKSVGKETFSSAEGGFAFENLEPGSYFLEVSKIGFGTVQSSTAVEAGIDKPPIVKIQLLADPTTIPRIDYLTFNGFIQCSMVTPAVRAAVCSLPGLVGVSTDDDFITYVDIHGVPDFAQAELVWETTQPLGDSLALQNFGGPRSSDGPSPQMINGDDAYWKGNTVADAGEQISFRVFAGGLPETQAGGTWGLGVTVDQDFEMYISVFYRTVPDEGWWFINDGAWKV